MHTSKRRVAPLIALILLLAAAVAGQACAAAWPTGTVTLNIPAAPGGTTDGLSRLFAENWRKQTGHSFVVVNNFAGNGTIASEVVRNAEPDGSELLLYNSSMCSLIATGQYQQSFDDFTVLGILCGTGPESTCILVNAESELQTYDDLVAYAKAHPGELLCGEQINSRGHFVQILIENEDGYSTTIVDSGSNANTITALLGGHIDMCCITTPSAAPYVASGDLRALVVNGDTKSVLLPEVPTRMEQGRNTVELPMDHFLLGPKGMSDAAIADIDAVLRTMAEDKDLLATMERTGSYYKYIPAREAQQYMRDLQAKYEAAYKIITSLDQ